MEFIVNPRVLGRPLPLQSLYGRSAPLEVEIGFGYGDFLVRRALLHPDRNFLGFDISLECERKTVKKIKNAGLTNVRLVRMDACLGLYYLPERSISVTYLNFPDPWPRKKHRKRRILTLDFLELLASRTRDGGEFYLVTDHRDYLEHALELFRNSPYWDFLEEEYTLEIPDYFDTKYRRKWEKMGKEMYFLRRVKVRHPDKVNELVEEAKEMPHVVLKKNEVDLERLSELQGQAIVFDDGVIRFHDIFENRRGDRVLMETLVSERRIFQKFFVLVEVRENEVIVKLAKRAEVAITPLVKKAIELVAEKLGGGVLRKNF